MSGCDGWPREQVVGVSDDKLRGAMVVLGFGV